MKPKLKFLRNTPAEEAAIQRGIDADPDTYAPSDAELKQLKPRGRPFKEQPKVPVTVRLDAEVAQFFRSSGEGWQTRLNALLAAHVKRASKRLAK